MHITDWFPTLLKLGQVDNYDEIINDIDGLDQFEVIFGQNEIPSPRY
jgi:hypothetical protein